AGYAPSQSEEVSTIEEWEEMILNESIFNPGNLKYLYTMSEFEGAATATELANEFNIRHQALNGSYSNLGIRIHQYTTQPYSTNKDGENCNWCVMFIGEYKYNSNHFTWKLKDNLHAALLNLKHKPKIKKYSKEKFLEEVFINEGLYDTMANL